MNPADLLRRGVAEFVGTFALIFIAAGSTIYQDLVGVAIATGLVIATMIFAVGPISGGHFNPAVTLGFLVTRRIGPLAAVLYWLVQFGAAALAALMLKWILPASAAPYGAPAVNAAIDTGKAVAIEALITFFLVWVIFATVAAADGPFNRVAGLAIGGTITMGTLMAFGLTGAAMNPARAFGPQLVANDWKNWWVWYVGPFAGAVIAAVMYELLYLRKPETDDTGWHEPAESPVEEAADEPADEPLEQPRSTDAPP